MTRVTFTPVQNNTKVRFSDASETLTLKNQADVSIPANTSTSSASLSGNTATFTRSDGSTFTLDLSSFESTNTSTSNASLAGAVATFVRADSSSFTLNLSELGDISANSMSIRHNLTVNGDIVLRGDSISIGDGGDIINLNASVNNHIIPAANVTYDLGSTTNSWRDLYLSGNTIFLGGLRLSDREGEKLQIVKKDDAANIIFDSSNTSAADMKLNVDSTAGAVANLTADTTVQDAIKRLNEAVFNVQKDTFVRDVTFVSDATQGGVGTTVTLTLTVTGNANRFIVDWGDGTSDTTVDTTPSHTYTSNAGSPYTVKVTAQNTGGSGANATADLERVDYITIFTADPAVNFDFFNSLTGGTALATLEANTGTPIYVKNTTRNIGNTDVTATFAIDWGDGGAVEEIAGKTEEGGTDGDRIDHTYSTGSGSSRFTVALHCNSHSTATPGIFPISNTALLKVFDTNISAPNDLTTKSISWNTSSVGTSPKLADGFVAHSSGKNAGDSISSTFPRYTSGTVRTNTMSTFFHTTNTVNQSINDGANTSATSDASGTDFYNLNASGSSVSAANRIYAEGLYETGAKSRIAINVSTDVSVGVNKAELVSEEGNSNELFFVKDSLTSSPSVDVSSVSLAENSVTYNYISGIPYYDSGDSLTLSGLSLSNITGQTYFNGNPVSVLVASNREGSSGTAISTQSYDYSTAFASSDRNGSIPSANLSSVSVEDLTVNIGTGDRAVQLRTSATNVNGTTNSATITDPIIQVFNGTDVINESAISVADSLGSTFTTDGKRISGFTGQTPSYSSSTDYYVDNAWSGAETVAGTDESIIRYGQLKHFDTDLSSGYLPVGPDLATGRSGAQYFRFAFKRNAVSNFRVRLSGKVSGFHFAVPGTAIDSASGSNGWLDASVQYAGSGVPGSDTANGGNGSDGAAFTGGDRIIDGTTYNNQTFDLTLGTESSTNAYNSQILISITLEGGDFLTALSIEST